MKYFEFAVYSILKASHHGLKRNESSYSQNIIQTCPNRVPAGYYYNSTLKSCSLTLLIHQEHSLILFLFLLWVSCLLSEC